VNTLILVHGTFPAGVSTRRAQINFVAHFGRAVFRHLRVPFPVSTPQNVVVLQSMAWRFLLRRFFGDSKAGSIQISPPTTHIGGSGQAGQNFLVERSV